MIFIIVLTFLCIHKVPLIFLSYTYLKYPCITLSFLSLILFNKLLNPFYEVFREFFKFSNLINLTQQHLKSFIIIIYISSTICKQLNFSSSILVSLSHSPKLKPQRWLRKPLLPTIFQNNSLTKNSREGGNL